MNFSRGVGGGVFVTLVEIPEGWGAISSLQKWKIQWGGGVLSEIPSVVGVWIFSGTTQLTSCTLSFNDDSSDLFFFLMGYFSLCPRYSLTFDLAEDQAETVTDASC